VSAYIVTPQRTITIPGDNLKVGAGKVEGSWIIFPMGDLENTKAVVHPGPDTVIFLGAEPPPIREHKAG
jgi:hypothetical protein